MPKFVMRINCFTSTFVYAYGIMLDSVELF